MSATTNGPFPSSIPIPAEPPPAKPRRAVPTPPPSPKNPNRRDSHVTFKTSDGVESHGTLVSMTRHSVTFEIYGPSALLTTSEMLADFAVWFQGKAIYWGTAVVRSLLPRGATMVFEAGLDESQWLAVDAKSLDQPNQQLGEALEKFIKEWQGFYIISDTFKVVVADLQTFLHQLQIWTNRVEVQIQSLPAERRSETETAALETIGKTAAQALDRMFERFEQATQTVSPSAHGTHSAFVKQALHPLLLGSPFLHRTFTKPLGYAGDYEMVNMLSRPPFEGDSMFAKIVNLWFWRQPPAEAHRNRLLYLERRLSEEALRLQRNQRKLRVFNFACGPAVEVQNFMRRSPLAPHAEFLLADFNQETLDYTRSKLQAIRGADFVERACKFQKKSVQQLLKESDKIAAAATDTSKQFDLVYCAGLFDYLSDRTCKELTSAFYNFVAPGGVMLVTNVDSCNPRRPTMDMVMEWHLIYRTAKELAELRPEQASLEDCSMLADATGVNIFLETRKPAHA